MQDEPQYANHDGSALRIWTDTAKNAFMSEKLGLPNFDEVIFIEVISPGSRGSQPVFEVKRTYSTEGAENFGKPCKFGPKFEEYKEFIAAYEANDTGAGTMAGTPLRSWPEISRSMAASLNEARIYTVEALANLPDGALKLVGPEGNTWRAKAQAFLALAGDNAAATALAAENERLRADLATAQAATAELAARMTALEAAASAPKAPEQPLTPPAPETPPVAAPTGKAGKGLPGDII